MGARTARARGATCDQLPRQNKPRVNLKALHLFASAAYSPTGKLHCIAGSSMYPLRRVYFPREIGAPLLSPRYWGAL
eukprot:3800256-Pyramimonas_sp.AAC.1